MSYGLIEGKNVDFKKLVVWFHKAVKKKLQQGWQLHGQHIHVIDNLGQHYMTQAIVKKWV